MADRRAPLGAIVRVVGAPAAPALYRLTRGRCRIGKGSDCNVVVSEKSVSRNHVDLTVTTNGVVVQDLASRNGTYYLDQRIDKMVLGFGGRVRIGGTATVVVDADMAQLQAALPYERDSYRGVLGRSAAMRRLFAMLARLEGSLMPVLIEGESGVGKEAVARALHEGSLVAKGPLVTLNCGALPRELVASELFGHKRGAFTGATDARKGALETAEGGTLFLDEIGELPLDVQPMLLRALESSEVRALGEDRARHVKVRVLSATNRALDEEVRAGRFREDLFYRLAVVRLRIPPLRERVEDVDMLAHVFAQSAGGEKLPSAVVEQLRARRWPGNARELRNTVQAYLALSVLPEPTRSPQATLRLALHELIDPRRPYADQKEALIDEFTRAYLEVLLERTGGNQSAAARIAGLQRGYLGRLAAKYGLVRQRALGDDDRTDGDPDEG
jgi:DNA-binding NtrC family response regulator